MTPSLRIAFVAPRFAEGAAIGGAETLLRSLAACLARAGVSVSFLTTCARNHFTWQNEVEPGTRRIGDLDVTFFPVDQDRDIASFLRIQDAICRGIRVPAEEEDLWLANSVNSAALCEHLRAHDDDYDRVVVGPYLFGLTYAVARLHPQKAILVPCLHDEPFARVSRIGDMFREVGRIMFNTEPERDLGVRLYDLDPSRCHVVGIGLDDFTSDPRAFAERRGIEAPYVVYCGRREPLKGTPLLVDYIAAFRARTGVDVKLVLTGSGPVDLPPDLAPHVIDAGFVSEAEKHDAMAGAVTFCHPSVNESLSIVLLESWLARTPALVHAGSAVMQHQCRRSNGGLWFRTYPEFEEALQLLLRNPGLRERMGKMGRDYVLTEYSWERIRSRLLAALNGS